ncbi:hypothetical protein ACFLQ2_05375 [archaeon]
MLEERGHRTIISTGGEHGFNEVIHDNTVIPNTGVVERQIRRDDKGNGYVDIIYQKAPTKGGQFIPVKGQRFKWIKDKNSFVQTHKISFAEKELADKDAFTRYMQREGHEVDFMYKPELVEVDEAAAEEIPAEEMKIGTSLVNEWIEDSALDLPRTAMMLGVSEEEQTALVSKLEAITQESEE